MLKGIDISNHNGNIDFNRVKNSGIDFVIIRSSYGWFYKDSNFENYVRGCESVGLPYGLYHYSYATNLEQAKIEVENFLNLARCCHPTYPLVIDMEDADGWKRKNGNPSNDMYVQICEYFCKKVEEAGYYAMIYANLDWFNNKLNDSRLDRFDKWVAQWASRCSYGKEYGIWQYSNAGRVDGISGNVDVNYSYKDYPSIINGGTPKPIEPSTDITGSTLELAVGVMNGNYGDGDTRKNKLGSRYNEVQDFINHIYSVDANTLANEVKEGKYGNGDIRKIVLGSRYNEVQNIVNQGIETTYIVVAGDNLTKIANKFGTTVNSLVAKNSIKDPNKIYVGQVLKI